MSIPGVHRMCLCLALTSLGCEGVMPDFSWERMIDQRYARPYTATRYLPDGRAMQHPPEGTVPANKKQTPRELHTGMSGDAYTTEIPLEVDLSLLSRGQSRFDTFCAPCHGLTGTGEAIVAHNMELRRPPSLVVEPVRSFPPGRVFAVVAQGYGLMPSYGEELSVHDRWAVAAYLRALQRSAAVELSSLPPRARADAEKVLR